MQYMLDQMLRRSEDLQDALFQELTDAEFDGSPRGEAVFGMCAVAFEHAAGLRLLLAGGCITPAIAILRLQYESLTRAMWLLYVAPESAVEKLSAPLTCASEQAAKGLPSQVEMLEQIRKGVGAKVPAAAVEMLDQFRKVSWRSLNSYVHAGIHVLRRQADGYPVQLILDVLRSSNGLSTMSGMTFALLTDEATAQSVGRIQAAFADCLPDLILNAD
jgi:hypothetical protein